MFNNFMGGMASGGGSRGGGNTLPPAGNGLTFEVFDFSSEFHHEMDFGAELVLEASHSSPR